MELTRKHCDDRKFAIGETLMGNVITRSAEKTIRVVREGTAERIYNASFYPNPMPTSDLRVVVSLEPKVSQFAFQVNCWGCKIEGGSCPRMNRSANKQNITVVIPAGFEGPVEILAMWGKIYGETFLSEPFCFQQEALPEGSAGEEL